GGLTGLVVATVGLTTEAAQHHENNDCAYKKSKRMKWWRSPEPSTTTGVTFMQSLSKENIEHLKEVVLPSEGVQCLVSKDMEDFLRIAAADKRMGTEVVTQKQLKGRSRNSDATTDDHGLVYNCVFIDEHWGIR
ncbi:hypothetical protein IFM89_014490, partial [Coptis chinensis]